MLSTIAVGTDGSATAGEAVDAAIELASATGARLLVFGAYSGSDSVAPEGGWDEEHWISSPAEAVHRVLEAARERAEQRDVPTQAFAGDGDAADVLIALAERHEVDVLVIGNKGVDRRILGSVPKSVVQHAPCNVYVIKTT
jgi:nucleotide-binding universal stress UspA family protein